MTLLQIHSIKFVYRKGKNMGNADKEESKKHNANIVIPLENHGSPQSNKKNLYVGRKEIIKKLVSVLKNTEDQGERGSYLIAGYRGVGKTSLIDRVIKQYERELNKGNVKTVKLNLGNGDQLNAFSLFLSISNILYEKLTNDTKYQAPQKDCDNKKETTWIKKIFTVSFFTCLEISILNILVAIFSFILLFVTFHLLNLFPQINEIDLLSSKHEYYSYVLLAFLITVVYWSILTIRERPKKKILADLSTLITRMSNEVTEKKSASIKYKPIEFQKSGEHKSYPLQAREAEEKLTQIIKNIKTHLNSNIIFVFDEIDKLGDPSELSIPLNNGLNIDRHETVDKKKSEIDSLLRSLKNFITTAKARFFFVAGRETLDSYYSERGSPNSLYESLFDIVFEIPSLLTDPRTAFKNNLDSYNKYNRETRISEIIEDYVCRRILKIASHSEKYYTLNEYYITLNKKDEDTKYTIITLRNFINYLTFHSWGNPKRLSSIFESFVLPKNSIKVLDKKNIIKPSTNGRESDHYLVFDTNQRRSFSLASEIFILFQYQLSREVTKTSDKLTVSALSALQYILKFHRYGFTRESLYRMHEAINIYRSPELNTIVDDLITQIFKSYIRRVRNGVYRYRFHSGFEQELRYISHVSEFESVSYNFSHDSMAHVKQFFMRSLEIEKDELVIAKVRITLGEMYAIEQSYDEASIHFCSASEILRNNINGCKENLKQRAFMNYIEAMMKNGDLEEHRHNYNHAATIYAEANLVIEQILRKNHQIKKHLKAGDSKWDLLKQPFWALQFLTLKRSFNGKNQIVPSHLYDISDIRYIHKMACLRFFHSNMEDSFKYYRAAYKKLICTKLKNKQGSERSGYLLGNINTGLSETILIYKSIKILNSKKSCNELLISFLKPYKGITSTYLETHTPKHLPLCSIFTIENYMTEAAKVFCKNRLYISAAITDIKLISYLTMMLDSFDSSNSTEIKGKVDYIYKRILDAGTSAISCINQARLLDTSHSTKDHALRDLEISPETPQKTEINITRLFDYLLDKIEDDGPVENQAFWQQSLWAHKLASTLYWAKYVVNKIDPSKEECLSSLEKFPNYFNALSIRSSILMRWVYARKLSKDSFDEACFDKVIFNDETPKYNPPNYKIMKKVTAETVLEKVNKDNFDRMFFYQKKKKENKKLNTGFVIYKLSDNGEKIVEKIKAAPSGTTHLKDAYDISKNLYAAIQSIRIISRKNLDMVFPTMSQIYYAQWKLLLTLATTIITASKSTKGKKNTEAKSIRDASLQIQKKLIDMDKYFSPHERIPSSHFDYEHIYLCLISSLAEARTLNDPTGRARSSILQQKYYVHDDFSDSEFRMDWTLSHMLLSSAEDIKERVSKAHASLSSL